VKADLNRTMAAAGARAVLPPDRTWPGCGCSGRGFRRQGSDLSLPWRLIGTRYNGEDAETGFDVEPGSGIARTHPGTDSSSTSKATPSSPTRQTFRRAGASRQALPSISIP